MASLARAQRFTHQRRRLHPSLQRGGAVGRRVASLLHSWPAQSRAIAPLTRDGMLCFLRDVANFPKPELIFKDPTACRELSVFSTFFND